MQISGIDLLIIVIYIIAIVGLGVWAGMKRKGASESKSYFLAGGTLTWPVIGLALFATNISTVHLVSLAQEGYANGLAYGNFEWMAAFTLIILAIFFAPFYIRSNVTTLPDFLEKRYSRASRDWLAVLSIISAIFIHIGFSLYAGAEVLNGMFGMDRMTSIVLIAGITGFYTIIGGLMAVVLTESLQTIILLVGAIMLTAIGYMKVGGWGGITEAVDPVKLTILRPAGDESGLPWYSVFLGYPIIGIWYWCTDQTIVQRVLGAKDENHARVGALFAGFIKILPVFIFVFPGLICYALVQKGIITALPLTPEGTPDTAKTYSHMIAELLPAGLRGLVAAALLAALMSTVSGALNSAATLFSYDLVKRWRPQTAEHKLVRIGQVVTGVGIILAVIWSPFCARFPSVFQGINAAISYIAPPIMVVFTVGVFWRGASSTGSIATLLLGSFLGLTVFILDFFKETTGWNVPFMMAGFYLACICTLILVLVSLLKPDDATEEQMLLVWKSPLEPFEGKAWSGIGNYKLLSLILAAVMVMLYVVFS